MYDHDQFNVLDGTGSSQGGHLCAQVLEQTYSVNYQAIHSSTFFQHGSHARLPIPPVWGIECGLIVSQPE